MSESVTMIVLGTFKPDASEAFAEYAAAAGPLLVEGGGQPVDCFKVTEAIKGGGPQFVAMMTFDTAEQVKAVFDSPTYQEIVPKRDAAFEDLSILIAEKN